LRNRRHTPASGNRKPGVGTKEEDKATGDGGPVCATGVTPQVNSYKRGLVSVLWGVGFADFQSSLARV